MKNFKVTRGVYPTMITPYKSGVIDEDAVRALVRFYWESGCNGIFAACQSSEIMFLSIEERVLLVRLVVDEARKLAETGDLQKAIVFYQQAIDSDETEEESYIELAKIYFATDN